MFENLKNALAEENALRETETRFYIQNGYMTTWASDNQKQSDNGLQRWSTPAKWAAYQASTITREKAVEYAVKRAIKSIEKSHAESLRKLQEAAKAPNLLDAYANMNWKRSSCYGYCPSVELIINGATIYRGRAGGYGYDKASAAMAEALNQSPSVMKALYAAADAALSIGMHFSRTSSGCVTWRDVLGYGSGYSVLPYFEGGVDVSCFETIFRKCGFRFRNIASSKHLDAYTITKA